jgi:hypothetical protein
VPISVACDEDPITGILNVAFQEYKVQGGAAFVGVSGRRYEFEDKLTWKTSGGRVSFSPYKPIPTPRNEDFKFRFNFAAFVDRDEDGRSDFLAYIRPVPGGSDIFGRPYNENSFRPNGGQRKLTPSVPGAHSFWGLNSLPPTSSSSP